MSSPQFLLSNYIKGLKDVSDINKHLYQNYNIMTKELQDLEMTIYYNKYSNKHKTQMELASRSVIMDKNYKVICYSCSTPIYNNEAIQYLTRFQHKSRETYVCYEGSLMSVFNYNNKWYLSSRRNIYKSNDEESGGQFKMFLEVLEQDNITFDEFTAKLNPELSYHFVLIHYKNENIVSYEEEFGKEYKKLCFIFARNVNTQNELKSETVENNSTFLTNNIFLPKKISNDQVKDYVNKLSENTSNQPLEEGIIIKINNNVLKLQSSSYLFYKSIGSDKNMFRGFLTLYQNNNLKKFFEDKSNEKFKKMVNSLNTKESFDTIGMIDALFKVLTAELHNLYYILWNDKEEHLNKDLYTILPSEYKDILFHLRGVFFSNKTKHTGDDNILELKDVYNFIKTIDINVLEKFIRCRKLMLNWVSSDKTPNALKFNETLHKSNKVFYKLSAIYTTKLYPEIMPNDLPTFGK
jgi:hypothetical protein